MKILSKENIVIYFLAILFFFLLLPYFVWHTPVVRYFIEILFVIISLFFIDVKFTHNKIVLSLILLCLILYLWGETSMTGIISNLFLVLIFNVKDDIKVKIFGALVDIFALVVGVSLVIYLLVCWLGVSMPMTVIEPLNPLKDTDYLQYPFLVVYNSIYNFANMRFYALFDEPGVVGTIATILLYSNEYKLSSWQYVVIFLSGFFSFSFFFFVMSIFFLLRKISIRRILLILSLFLIIYYTFNDIFVQNKELFDKLIFSRFTAEGDYGGDRVGIIFNQEYSKFLSSLDIFWGKGSEELNKILLGGSSYKSLIYSNGIIWFFAMSFFFIMNIVTIGYNKKVIFYSIMIFVGVLYQRPNVFDLPYFFMFITLPLILQRKYDERRVSVYSIS